MSEATIVALYDHYNDASQAVTDLIQAGAERAKISLLANNINGDHPALTTNPSFGREEFDTKDQKQPAAVTGAEFGIGVGGIFGVLVGTGAIMVPGIGALIAAGTLATLAVGAAAGGIVGGAIGLLTEHGVSSADSHLYAEGLKRGGTLVTVAADDGQLDAFRDIFKRHGAVDIGKRGAHWEAEGWVSFDPDQPHLTPEELETHRRSLPQDAVEHHHHVRHYAVRGQPDHLGTGASNVTTHYGEDETRT
ncbi:MAG TPA: hypothetical protein VH722_04210 [Alphaproteobacteria bacterium]|jgi:hypothetical protein|nr:hypothetical protein [Alphaproteobacteria bacterium]